MLRSAFIALALFLGFVALPATSSAEEDQPTATEKLSWGRLHTRFLDDGSPVTEARQMQPEASDPAVEPEAIDWSSFEASQKVMAAFNVSPFDITAVQAVVPINADGSRGDSTEVVITSTGTDYFYVPSTGTISSTPPKGFLTGQAMYYGGSIDRWQGSVCGGEYAVVFTVPWCMHETSPRIFGGTPGVVDAWAMGVPPCTASCWGVQSPSAPAWEGDCDRGFTCWYNYQSCGRWDSVKAGKMVQKRWLFGWRHCGWSDYAIARSVSALIRY